MDVFAAVVAGVGALSSIIGGRKADKRARRAAAEEARLEEAVTREKLRRLEVEERVLAGETRGAYAASGVRVDQGSPLQILAEQHREFVRERGIVREVGATRASQALARGRMVGSQYRDAAYSSAANQLATMFSFIQAARG